MLPTSLRAIPNTVGPVIIGPSNDFNLGERKNELAAIGEELLLARDNAILEMPGQHQEIVGLHRARLRLRDDRNVRPRRERAELVLVHFRDRFDQFRSYAAELQDDIALGRGAVSQYALTVVLERAQEPRQILAMAKNALLEIAERRRRSEPHAVLLLQEPVDHGGIAPARTPSVHRGEREAAAIHRIHLDVENIQSSGVEYLLQSTEGVIFDVFMADRAV